MTGQKRSTDFGLNQIEQNLEILFYLLFGYFDTFALYTIICLFVLYRFFFGSATLLHCSDFRTNTYCFGHTPLPLLNAPAYTI